MFLSKRSNGIYYLVYNDRAGHRRRVSTHARSKSDAVRFLRGFSEAKLRRPRVTTIPSLSEFTSQYLECARSRYSAKYIESIVTSLRALMKSITDLQLDRIDVIVCENQRRSPPGGYSGWGLLS